MKIYTRKQAIDNHCKDCIYDPQVPGTWRDQTEACTMPNCKLFVFRPLSTATLKKLQEEKISKMNKQELEQYRKKQETARISLAKRK